jgi:opacity protein-like surface antigen
MATLRARAGFAVDRVLIFATGGLALSDWSTSHTFTYFSPPDVATYVDVATVEVNIWNDKISAAKFANKPGGLHV